MKEIFPIQQQDEVKTSLQPVSTTIKQVCTAPVHSISAMPPQQLKINTPAPQQPVVGEKQIA